MELRGVQAVAGASLQEFSISGQVLVVAGVKGVVSTLGLTPCVDVFALTSELQGEKGILAPGHGSVHVYLVLGRAEVSETLSAGRP